MVSIAPVSILGADQMQARILSPFMKTLTIAPIHHEATAARETSIQPNHDDR
jgi:hypothetical protein